MKRFSKWFSLFSVMLVIFFTLTACGNRVNTIVVTYEASLQEWDSTSNLDQEIDATILRLQDLLFSKGYTRASVQKQGNNKIRVSIFGTNEEQHEIFRFIAGSVELFIRKTESTSADDNILTGKDVENVYASAQQNSGGGYTHGVVLNFTDEGKNIFYNLTSELAVSGGSLYIYLGENLFLSLSVGSAIAGGSTFISGGNITDAASAEEFALRILSGTFKVNLTMLNYEVFSA